MAPNPQFISLINTHDFAVREKVGENIQRKTVIRIIKYWHQNDSVRD